MAFLEISSKIILPPCLASLREILPVALPASIITLFLNVDMNNLRRKYTNSDNSSHRGIALYLVLLQSCSHTSSEV